MKNKFLKVAISGLLLTVGSANAAIITDGFTYSVASGSNQSVGNHYHSNTGGVYGNAAGKAEVGNFGDEEVRGLSEYSLVGQSAASSAFVTFDVFGNGLFSDTNDFAFNGFIDVNVYQGNNAENVSDYQATSIGSVGSFSTVGLAIGDIFSFDITTIFNDAIVNGWSSLGIRLSTENTVDDGGAWTFDDFRLTTTDITNTSVPEPSSLAIFALGLIGLASRRFKKKS